MIDDMKLSDSSSDETKILKIKQEKEVDFKSPEEVAKEDANTKEHSAGDDMKKNKKPRKKLKDLSKKQIIIISLVAFLIMGGALGWWFFLRKTSSPTQQVTKTTAPPKPTTEPSKLSGLEVALDVNKRPVTGVMIENSPDARPQSGLNSASVVFEAIAEGGITRFLALFQDTQPDYIGPIRSARPYYLEWLLPFDASLAHVGGSPDALASIKTLGVKDLDQFANGGSYQRVSSRYAPHNVYSSTEQLNQLEASKGFGTSNFTGFNRKKDAPVATPTAKSIDMNVSAFLYNPHYDWDAASNTYKRSEAGKPHINERDGAQISPKVVVGLVMTRGYASDGQHTVYGTTGSGKMYVFQDGTVTEGVWKKASPRDQFEFLDTAGNPLKFNAGPTWLSVVGDAGAVTYSP